MKPQKTILLKLTGAALLDQSNQSLSKELICSIAEQIKELQESHYFGIVIGGGNFFRGSQHGKQLEITPAVGHQVGMLATVMNGLILKDIFEQHDVTSSLFCAIPSGEIGMPISQQAINHARNKHQCMIFTGGTGNPFFTTDTTAVLRALQIEADQVWKGTNIDGIYDADPRTHTHAKKIKHLSYDEALQRGLRIMDATAYAMAREYHMPIRVFNIFSPKALINASKDLEFGSIVT